MSLVNLKDAGRFLNSVDSENIEVLTLPAKNTTVNPAVSVPILDLFTEKEIYYRYDESFTPSPGKIKESSLRFTWEYKNPEYYYAARKSSRDNSTVAIVSNGPVRELPGSVEQRLIGYKKIRVFKNSPSLFRYRPFVTVYQP